MGPGGRAIRAGLGRPDRPSTRLPDGTVLAVGYKDVQTGRRTLAIAGCHLSATRLTTSPADLVR
jgi:hypothetical protein